MKLLETVMCGSTKWLIMGPVGDELPFSPASVVLTHMDELASCVERLHGAGWLHCDISYDNCLVFQPEGKAGFIDLGAAKTISQVRLIRHNSPDLIMAYYMHRMSCNLDFCLGWLACALVQSVLAVLITGHLTTVFSLSTMLGTLHYHVHVQQWCNW